MAPLAAAYLFLLGLAGGVALLTLTAYRRVSPPWLRRLLIASGMLVISRYVAMAAFATTVSPPHAGLLRHCWFGSSIGLTLPSLFAVDQLIRHPAMTPKKLLTWSAPLWAVYGAVILAGQTTVTPDRFSGWSVHLTPDWRILLSVTQAIFVTGFIGACALFLRKIPSRSARVALIALAFGQGFLALDGLLLLLGIWYARPFLFSEVVMLIALWYTYDTSASVP